MASNIARQYKRRYERAEDFAAECNFEAALSICFELRLKHDLGLWRRALVNLLIATIGDDSLDRINFARESVSLLRQVRIEGLPTDDAFENIDLDAKQLVAQLEAEAKGKEPQETRQAGVIGEESAQDGKQAPERKGLTAIAGILSSEAQAQDMEGEDEQLELSSDASSEVTVYESWKVEKSEEEEEFKKQQKGATLPEARVFSIEGFLREDYGEDQSAHDHPLLSTLQPTKATTEAKQSGLMTPGMSSDAVLREDQR